VKFFFDNNLAPKLARTMSAAIEPEHEVIHLKERFKANEEDAVWMRKLAGEQDWIIVTTDVRISRNPHEVRAWQEAGHTIFFLKPGWTDLTFWEQMNKFSRCFPEIIQTAESAEQGSCYFVSVNGKIQK